jgi:hypothetical protein
MRLPWSKAPDPKYMAALMKVSRLLIAGLFFFIALLFIFLRFFDFLLTLILLAFVSHSFLLRFLDFSVLVKRKDIGALT